MRASKSFVVGEAPSTYSTILAPRPPVSFDLGDKIELPSGNPPGRRVSPRAPAT